MTSGSKPPRNPRPHSNRIALGAIALVGLSLGTGGAMTAARGGTPVMSTHPAEEPIACRLDVFDSAERARHDALTAELRAEVRETQELRDGYALRLPAHSRWVPEAGRWMALERRCCPFFDFQLTWRRGEEAPWLRITGPPGVKAMVAAFVDSRH